MARPYRSILPSLIRAGFLLIVFSAGCSPSPRVPPGRVLPLISYTDPGDGVKVVLRLRHSPDGSFQLSATFTAPKGYHLYSKDLPIQGVYGHGRPTRVDLTPRSKMRPAGGLETSSIPEIYGHEMEGPPVYPEGPLTLILPVELPSSSAAWVEDEVALTYQTCSLMICTPPVEGKQVSIRVPSQAGASGGLPSP